MSCRTARRGGHLHHCTDCQQHHYVYHSCNHRACPRCGAREQAEWTRRQEARLLPVPYYLLTVTVPAELRGVFLRYPVEMVLPDSRKADVSKCAEIRRFQEARPHLTLPTNRKARHGHPDANAHAF
jgi:Transposase zinc-binding domain